MSEKHTKRHGNPASTPLNAPATPATLRRPAASSNAAGPIPATPTYGLYETPVRPKEGEYTAVTVNNMSGRRLAAIEDAGAVHPEVPLTSFFKYLLPLRKCLKQHNAVQMVVEKLKKGEDPLLKHDYSSDAFVWHDILSKQEENATEKATYTTLEDIARRIEEIVKESAADLGEELEPVVQYKDAPTKAPKSLNRTSKHIPDGYFILRNRQEGGSADHWVDIGVVGEFKRGQGRNDTNKVRFVPSPEFFGSLPFFRTSVRSFGIYTISFRKTTDAVSPLDLPSRRIVCAYGMSTAQTFLSLRTSTS